MFLGGRSNGSGKSKGLFVDNDFTFVARLGNVLSAGRSRSALVPFLL